MKRHKEIVRKVPAGKRAPSIGENICRITLEAIFGRKFPTVHPDFLRSTRSGICLELDGYCEPLALAFEYNGEQHYSFPNGFHANQYKFMVQVQNDRFKRAVCRRVGITLVVIPYTIAAEIIPEYIANLLPPEYEPFRLDLVSVT
jgi:hypothetical protein